MSIRNKRLNETSLRRLRRAKQQRVEKIRKEVKRKLAVIFSKNGEIRKESVTPVARAKRPVPSSATPRPVPVRVLRPLPVRAYGPVAQPQPVQCAPVAQTMPMGAPTTAVPPTPVAAGPGFAEHERRRCPPHRVPSPMSVRSSSDMQIADDDGFNMQGGRWMSWAQHQLPTPRPTPSPSRMGVRSASAMEVEDDDRVSRMSITPMPMPNPWGFQQHVQLNSDAHRLLILEERYNALRGFVRQLYQSMCDESFQAAMDVCPN